MGSVGSIKLSPIGLMIVHICALTLTGLIVRAIDPMRSLMLALRRNPQISSPEAIQEDENSIVMLTNNAMLLGLNASLLGGVLAERAITVMRPKTCAAWGYVLWALGWAGLLQNNKVLVCIGSVCLGLSFPAILNAILFLTALQKSHTLGLSLLSTSADISTFIPFFLSKIIKWTNFDRNPRIVRIFLISFAVISTVLSATSTLLCTSNQHVSAEEEDDFRFEIKSRLSSLPGRFSLASVYRTAVPYKTELRGNPVSCIDPSTPLSTPPALLEQPYQTYRGSTPPPSPVIVITSPRTIPSSRGAGVTSPRAEDSSNAAAGGAVWQKLLQQNEVPSSTDLSSNDSCWSSLGSAGDFLPAQFNDHDGDNATVCEKISSLVYLMFAIVFCFNILRTTHFLCWNRATLEVANASSVNVATVDASMNLYNILTVLAFVPGFGWGKVSQSLGVLKTNILLNLFGVIATYATTNPLVSVQRLGIVSFVIHQSFVFSNMFCFLSDVFGFKDLVWLEGVLALVAVLVNSMLIFWNKIVMKYLDGDWVFVGRIFTIAGLIVFVVPIGLMLVMQRRPKWVESKKP